MQLGTGTVSKLYLGANAVDKVMLGASEVWSSAFDPLSLSPALWLDASDASTLYDATTGGGLVAADGAVARWEDKSGNSRHATQATSGSRPLRKTAVKNGLSVARFDGGDVIGNLAAPLPIQPSTVYLVALQSTDTANAGWISRTPATGNDWDQTTATVLETGAAGIIIISAAAFPSLQTPESGSGAMPWSIICLTIAGGNVANLYRNDITTPKASDSTFSALSSTSTGYLVGGRFLSGVIAPGNRVIGDIAEILVFPTAHSEADRQAVERYLGAKWGITVA